MSKINHTPTPWGWVVHDHSCASLGVLPDPGLGDPLVLSVSPCRSCADRAEPKKWAWGRCCTPSEADAAFIVRAVNSHDKMRSLLTQCLPLVDRRLGDEIRLALSGSAALASLDQEKPAQPVSEDNDCNDYYVPDESGYSRADEEWFFGMDGKP